jgi:hypothetical protein
LARTLPLVELYPVESPRTFDSRLVLVVFAEEENEFFAFGGWQLTKCFSEQFER